jgi:hypothetical protein
MAFAIQRILIMFILRIPPKTSIGLAARVVARDGFEF